jgi:tRNA(adenine34) deaminase
MGMMALAIAEAQKGGQKSEVPVGAVLVGADGEILAQTHNLTLTLADVTAHAEILALREAARIVHNYRLVNTTLYVTVEPCLMCMGAIIHARVAQVVFGVKDPKWGAAGSLYDFSRDTRLNHRPQIVSGVRETECRELMQAFFRVRR